MLDRSKRMQLHSTFDSKRNNYDIPDGFPPDLRIFFFEKGTPNWARTNISVKTLVILNEMCNITQCIHEHRINFATPSNGQDPPMYSAIKERLYSLSDVGLLDHPINHVFESCRIAALLYCKGHSRDGCCSSRTRSYVAQLICQMSQTDTTKFWYPATGAYIWCLTIGIHAAEVEPARLWLQAHWIRVCCWFYTQSEVPKCINMILYGLTGCFSFEECALGPFSSVKRLDSNQGK